MTEGWIKLHRKLFDNPLAHKVNYLSIWVFLLTNANHTDSYVIVNNNKLVVKKGQYFGSIVKIAAFFKLSKSTVSSVLEYLEIERMIERNKNGGYSLITILNWDEYQEVEREAEQKSNKSRTKVETYNNDKNVKNEKNNNIYTSPKKLNPRQELITLAAEMQGIRQFTNYAKQLKAISLIEKAGHTLEDIKFVMEEMGKEDYWKTNTFDLMNVYNNFDRYMNRTVMYKTEGSVKKLWKQ